MDEELAYDFPEANFSDPVAERTEAFGNLALKIATITDPEVKELTMVMLKMIIRSIHTPPTAELVDLKLA
jgi:hypothetical protein